MVGPWEVVLSSLTVSKKSIAKKSATIVQCKLKKIHKGRGVIN